MPRFVCIGVKNDPNDPAISLGKEQMFLIGPAVLCLLSRTQLMTLQARSEICPEVVTASNSSV